MTDRDRLRTLARDIAPGPWTRRWSVGKTFVTARMSGAGGSWDGIIAEPYGVDYADWIAAADPSTVLALLARLAEAEGLLAFIHDEAFALAAEQGDRWAQSQADRITALLAPSTPTEAQ